MRVRIQDHFDSSRHNEYACLHPDPNRSLFLVVLIASVSAQLWGWISWTHGAEHMRLNHGIQVEEANEAITDVAALSTTLVHRDDRPGSWWEPTDGQLTRLTATTTERRTRHDQPSRTSEDSCIGSRRDSGGPDAAQCCIRSTEQIRPRSCSALSRRRCRD